MEKIRYFDNAATTKISDDVLKSMLPYLTIQYGNPSSLYSIGREAKREIENARKKVADLIGAKSNEIYFTGCGSESDNMALKGVALANKYRGNHIITSKIEHPAILNSCECLEKQGFKISYINVHENGVINLEELNREITDETILISVMLANNEIGTIQPIEEISKIAKNKGILFHTDAVQACGNIPIDVNKLGVDMLSLSGHKIQAPKGIGALYIKSGTKIEKFMDGGHQERDKRAGTENVASIVGLGKACEIADKNIEKHMQYLQKLRDYFIEQVEEKIPFAKLNGDREKRLPGNANFSFKDVDGGELLLKLDARGICASSGSACSSGSSSPSHVLVAIGLKEELANGALRITFGEENTKEDLDYLIKNLYEIIEEIRKSQ